MSGAQFKPQFKAIVVGGGPVGLIAAQILSKAGLDFVVLERGSTTYPDLGASLILYPMTFRIFDQLGILDEIDKISTGLKHSFVNTLEGEKVKDTEFKSETL
jgi:2-polyprenyl-6-methoxyphenol hydroxylase-like FAD-dependent oxidoreductase